MASVSCADGGPDSDPIPGRWLLETVNGQALPTTGQVLGVPAGIPETVVGGRLVIPDGGAGPAWDYCTEDEQEVRRLSGRDDGVYFPPESEGGPAELFFPLAAGGGVRDTITLASDVLTWEYNLRSSPGSATDLLRFRRLEAGEFTGSPCSFLP